MSAPAFVGSWLHARRSASAASRNGVGAKRVAKLLEAAAVSEVVFDKMPFVPARITPGALIVRILSGALCGATLSRESAHRTGIGAAVGGLSALGAAYAFYHLRMAIGRTLKIPDPLIGLGEDAIVAAGGALVTGRNGSCHPG
jgi:uncharacterized membrane protein